jgi:excisionase family DNA binding protein
MDDVLAVNIAEAARLLGVSPRTVATLVACKELPSRKIGRRRVTSMAYFGVSFEASCGSFWAALCRAVSRIGVRKLAVRV